MNIIFRDASWLTPAHQLLKAAKEVDAHFDLYCEDFGCPNKPHWAFDNYRCNGTVCPDASHLFYTQPGWGKYFQELVGTNKSKLLTYAVDEDIYPEVESEKIYDVGFIGNINEGDQREPYITALKMHFNCYISTTTPTEKIAEELSRCKVVFNHIRYEEINIRFFESLACGAQVCSYSPALHMFAEEGRDYLTFRSIPESIEKIQYLINNSKKAYTMRKRAREGVLERHTYKHRVQEILNFL